MRSEDTGSRFGSATAVRPLGAHRYAAELDAAWGAGGHPNGAYLLAVLGRAALADTGRTHPHGVQAAFVRPAAGGSAEVRVSTLRSGRTATHARVSLHQDGESLVDTTWLLGEPPAPAAGDRAPRPAPLPTEEVCEPAVKTSDRPGMLDCVELRYDPAAGPRTAGDPEIRAWFRLRDGAAPDVLAALFATDALPPAVAVLGHRGWAPTAQLSAQLYRPPAPGPLAVTVTAGQVRDGWFDERAVVADSTGAPVATAWQLARLPRP